MKLSKWGKILITAAIVLAADWIGMLLGQAVPDSNLLGELGWQINCVEHTGMIFSIIAAAGCVFYFDRSAKN